MPGVLKLTGTRLRVPWTHVLTMVATFPVASFLSAFYYFWLPWSSPSSLATCVHDPPASLLLGCRRLETDTRLDNDGDFSVAYNHRGQLLQSKGVAAKPKLLLLGNNDLWGAGLTTSAAGIHLESQVFV